MLLAAGGAWLLLRPQPAATISAAPTWIARLDTSLSRITVTPRGGTEMVVERSDIPDVWLLREGPAAWPISGQRISALTRLITDLERSPAVEPADASGVRVTLRDNSGEHALSIGPAALGGKALIKIEGNTDSYRLADAGLARVFEGAGLRAWREPRPFISLTGESADFSRVRLQTVGRQVIVAKVAGRWGVQVPLAAPADQDSCLKVASMLAGLTLERLVDQPPGGEDALGLASPSAIIDTETDFRTVRGGDVQRRVLLQQLKIGGPADPSGKSLWASVQAQWMDPATRTVTSAWGPALGVIRRADVEPLSADVTGYLARRSVQVPSEDVSRVTVVRDDAAMRPPATTAATPADLPPRRLFFERYLDAWRMTPLNGSPREPAPSEHAELETLLELLCDIPADAIGDEPPAGTVSMLRIRLEATGAGGDIGVGAAQVTKDGTTRPAVVLRVGPLFRVYFAKPAIDVVKWLGEMVPVEG